MDLLLLTPIDPLSYQIMPDLGLMYLAAAAREAGFSVDIKDCRKERWGLDDLGEHVRRARPTVLGIKVFSNEVARAARMAETARREFPEAVIIVGGPHPSMAPENTLKRMSAVDYAFIGEAERTLVPFLAWVKSGRKGTPPEEVKGIAWRDGDKVSRRELCLESDLDSLPLPAWDLMPPSSYPDEALGLFAPAFPAAPMIMSRGCPYRCTYCGSYRIAGKRYRYRSVENSLAEMEMLEREYGIRTFAFVDNSFTSERKRALAFFQALRARPKQTFFTFPNGVRASSLDAELLQAMEKAGCRQMSLGVESSSDRTLSRMKKDQKIELITKTVDMIRKNAPSIVITGSFILGFPGETMDDVKGTIRYAVKLPVHHAHFCVFIPLPGSTVYEDLVSRGLVCEDQWDPEKLTMDRSTSELPGLPARKLVRLHQRAYLRFYLEPWRLLSFPGQIKSLSHLKVILRTILKVFH
jgi:radical SAM superfamily enzyme YgiQ (UPF0313 family)